MAGANHLKTQGHFKEECIIGLQGLADYLGVSRQTAWSIKNQNIIPYYKVGRMYYFRAQEILDAISSRSSDNLNGK